MMESNDDHSLKYLAKYIETNSCIFIVQYVTVSLLPKTEVTHWKIQTMNESMYLQKNMETHGGLDHPAMLGIWGRVNEITSKSKPRRRWPSQEFADNLEIIFWKILKGTLQNHLLFFLTTS